MSNATRHDAWQAGDGCDAYMGRWSREAASRFLGWFDGPRGGDWLEVGFGTGALSAAILSACSPASLIGIDPSEGFIATARRRARLDNRRHAGDARRRRRAPTVLAPDR